VGDHFWFKACIIILGKKNNKSFLLPEVEFQLRVDQLTFIFGGHETRNKQGPSKFVTKHFDSSI
jgi:hypothetical protein